MRYDPYNRYNVTPNSIMIEAYEKALARLREAKCAVRDRIVKDSWAMIDLKLEKARQEFKALTGNSLDFSHQSDPKEDSPLGKILAKELKPFVDKGALLLETFQEASLRVSLGKGADEKMAQLKKFQKDLEKIVGK